MAQLPKVLKLALRPARLFLQAQHVHLAAVAAAHLQLHLLLQVTVLLPKPFSRCLRARSLGSDGSEVAQQRRHFLLDGNRHVSRVPVAS